MQTSHSLSFPSKFPGQQADHRVPTEVITGVAGEELVAGDLVYVSTYSEDKLVVKKLDATNLEPIGVVLFEHRESGKFPDKADVPIMTKGVIWFNKIEGDITAGATPHIDSTTATIGMMQTGTSAAGDKVLHGARTLSAVTEVATGEQPPFKLQVNFPMYISTTA